MNYPNREKFKTEKNDKSGDQNRQRDSADDQRPDQTERSL